MSEPWEDYPEVWPTKSKFFTWLRGCFRKAVWNRYPGKVILKNQECKQPPEGYTGRAKSGTYCALTGAWVGKSALEVDHIKGEASLKDWKDVESFIKHLCASPDNLQLVSKEAHKVKSYAERAGISFQEAIIEKQVIEFSKKKASEQIKFLTDECKYEIISSNSKQRVEKFREWLKQGENK